MDDPKPDSTRTRTEIALRFLEGIGQSRVLCDYALNFHRGAVNGAMNLIKAELEDHIVDEVFAPIPNQKKTQQGQADGLDRRERLLQEPKPDEDVF